MSELNYVDLPRVVIGAPHGRSGKTTISIGLVGALKKAGHRVQPFKKGPDYIDPSWLAYAAGRDCRNLDCYWFNEKQIVDSLVNSTRDADIALIEGAMGLFDGIDLQGTGSTAQIARYTDSPIILVVDTTRMTRSIAPLVQGFMNFDSSVRVAGVILNKVARSRHENMLRAAIKEYCGIPVLGAVPRNAYNVFPERHLGLVPVTEHTSVLSAVEQNIAIAQEYIDLKGIMDIASTATKLPQRLYRPSLTKENKVRIGVIKDEVFSFYYPENLEALAVAGAELIYINSLKDKGLPNIDGLYIGGGFPECFMNELEANTALRSDIKEAAHQGLPIYAECGGLMYLGRELIWDDKKADMCNAMPFSVELGKKPQGHGYSLMKVTQNNPFFAVGNEIKGHEFHHSRIVDVDNGLDFSYEVLRGHGIDGLHDGVSYRNTFATYHHIHALAYPEWAINFVASAVKHNKKSNAK